MIRRKLAWVMELADMRVSKTRESNLVGVRLSPQAPLNGRHKFLNTFRLWRKIKKWQKNLEKLFIGTTK